MAIIAMTTISSIKVKPARLATHFEPDCFFKYFIHSRHLYPSSMALGLGAQSPKPSDNPTTQIKADGAGRIVTSQTYSRESHLREHHFHSTCPSCLLSKLQLDPRYWWMSATYSSLPECRLFR